MNESSWNIYAASATGKGHLDLNIPCQDAFDFRVNNNNMVAVVCDGAGSAPRSELGSKTCSTVITDFLINNMGVSCLDKTALIMQAIEDSRAAIKNLATLISSEPAELACTVVGAIVDNNGGYLFHIGDGIGFALLRDGSEFTSYPENGEYANETYFVTQEDWKNHLRFTALPPLVGSVILMSDGTMSFACKKNELWRPFIDPVTKFLRDCDVTDGSDALLATLSGENTWNITRDDKTLLFAARAFEG